MDISQLTDGIKGHYRKEKHFDHSYSVVYYDSDTAEVRSAVQLRLYSATGQVWYACMWIRYKDTYGSGSGKASGYGYDKPSAASFEAFRSAGIQCHNFAGHGHTAIIDALEQLGQALDLPNQTVLYNHG